MSGKKEINRGGCLVFIILFAIGMTWLVLNDKGSSDSEGFDPGTKIELKKQTYLEFDKKSYDEFVHAVMIKDQAKFDELVNDGKAIEFPVGTKMTVDEWHVGYMVAKLEDGQKVWVTTELTKKE
jgi:hypothetical protein